MYIGDKQQQTTLERRMRGQTEDTSPWNSRRSISVDKDSMEWQIET